MTPPRDPIEGSWQLVRAEVEGAPAPALMVAKTEIGLHAGAYEVRFDGQITDRGTFEVGSIGSFNTLLLRGIEGPNAHRTIPCIYQLVGDRLRICYGLDGVRPEGFASTQGPQYLATYRRNR